MPHAFSRRLGESPKTNTFGANRFKLAVHGLADRVREINRAGVKLARDVRESTGRARLREAGDRAGIELAQSLVHEVRGRYAGAYLMPSFGRFEVVAEVLDAIH